MLLLDHQPMIISWTFETDYLHEMAHVTKWELPVRDNYLFFLSLSVLNKTKNKRSTKFEVYKINLVFKVKALVF